MMSAGNQPKRRKKMLKFDSGIIDTKKEIIELDVDNLDGLANDLIQRAFNEV